ncbi:hypothetical protein G6011_03682 [Alternaria panax]|uniref:Uncharacterized protein n=1 Tax=Alternaria panax TaxID=48097 RepID=A0AAD4IF44_9PLEO|nr:hypothetical protein G6011_03682 [Alternaria panax]
MSSTAIDGKMNARELGNDQFKKRLFTKESHRSRPDQVNKPLIALVTLFFLCVGYVMPAENFEYLQRTISRTLEVLTGNGSPPSFLFLYEYGREPIITALYHWQKAVADAFPARTSVPQAKATVQRWKDMDQETEVMAMANSCCNKTVFPSLEVFNNSAKTVSLNSIDNILLRLTEPIEHPMRFYYAYQRAQGELSSRSDVQHWLFSVFLKIALAACLFGMKSYVYAPLKSTMFFRLIVKLHELGHPAHWLFKVLSAILSNQ